MWHGFTTMKNSVLGRFLHILKVLTLNAQQTKFSVVISGGKLYFNSTFFHLMVRHNLVWFPADKVLVMTLLTSLKIKYFIAQEVLGGLWLNRQMNLEIGGSSQVGRWMNLEKGGLG